MLHSGAQKSDPAFRDLTSYTIARLLQMLQTLQHLRSLFAVRFLVGPARCFLGAVSACGSLLSSPVQLSCAQLLLVSLDSLVLPGLVWDEQRASSVWPGERRECHLTLCGDSEVISA